MSVTSATTIVELLEHLDLNDTWRAKAGNALTNNHFMTVQAIVNYVNVHGQAGLKSLRGITPKIAAAIMDVLLKDGLWSENRTPTLETSIREFLNHVDINQVWKARVGNSLEGEGIRTVRDLVYRIQKSGHQSLSKYKDVSLNVSLAILVALEERGIIEKTLRAGYGPTEQAVAEDLAPLSNQPILERFVILTNKDGKGVRVNPDRVDLYLCDGDHRTVFVNGVHIRVRESLDTLDEVLNKKD